MRKPVALYWGLAGSVLVLSVLGTTQEGFVLFPQVASIRASLVAALEGHRLSEGRLTGGFAPAPVEAASQPPLPELIRVSALIQEQLRHGPSPQARADAAIVALATDDVEQAVEELEQAVEDNPEDAALLSDLAAAYLARADRKSQPFDFARAGSAARRAVERSPGLPEAWFNLALSLQKLNARNKAVAAWETYLELDPGSPWSTLASDHLALLRAPARSEEWTRLREELQTLSVDAAEVRGLVARFPLNIREHAETEILGRWGELASEGRLAEAREALDLAREIGLALADFNGERMVADTVEAIDRAGTAGDHESWLALAQGHRSYRSGRRAYDEYDLLRARANLDAARRELAQSGSPLSAWARFFLALCDYQEERRNSARGTVLALRDSLQGERYPSLLARIDWVDGLISSQEGDLMQALAPLARAAERFERGGEQGYAGFVHNVLAQILEAMGETDQAWNHLYTALLAVDEISQPRQVQSIFSGAAFALHHHAETAAFAGDFDDEAVAAAERTKNPALLAVALTSRAQRAAGLRLPEAASDLETAAAAAGRLPASAFREGLMADIEMARGEWLASSQPEAAIRSLTAALRFDSQSGYASRRVGIYRSRAAIYTKLGDDARAESDLRLGLAEVERQRALILDDMLRTSYFEVADALFDEMLAFQLRHQRSEADLFATVESGRARTLLDLFPGASGKAAHPASLSEVERSLPPDTVLVEYAVAQDRLLALVITSGGSRSFEVAFDRKSIELDVRRLLRDVKEGSVSRRGESASRALGQLVLGSFASNLPTGGNLIFVLDDFLHRVPFAALRSPHSGRLLVEDHALAVAPSATIYLKARESACAPRTGESRVAVIGNPAFDRNLTDLEDLPGAEEEGRQIAALFPGSHLLLGADATPQAVLGAFESADLIHVAVHAVMNPSTPLLSRLLLAPAPDGSSTGLLYAHEIYRRSFRRPRLVFLSGCRTAAGQALEREGLQSLARPFLAAGVPAVIGSLVKVSDQKTTRFAVDVYRRLKTGADPFSAFHRAQLDVLRKEPSSRAWASFQFQGGSCTSR